MKIASNHVFVRPKAVRPKQRWGSKVYCGFWNIQIHCMRQELCLIEVDAYARNLQELHADMLNNSDKCTVSAIHHTLSLMPLTLPLERSTAATSPNTQTNMPINTPTQITSTSLSWFPDTAIITPSVIATKKHMSYRITENLPTLFAWYGAWYTLQ